MSLRSNVALWIGVALIAQACGSSAPKPNLVLVSLDTMRVDRLSRSTTPNLKRLAAESVVFTDTLAQSTATASSHMSLFTGQYVHRHGLHDNTQTSFPRTTLASVLRDHGWRTAAFTGHGSLKASLGHGVGFEVFESQPEGDGKRASRNLPEVVPQALEWLDVRGEEPFFLFVHGYDPHCPYAPPERWRSDRLDEYRGSIDLESGCGMRTWAPLFESGAMGSAELEQLNRLYDDELRAADAVIGELLDGLRERDLLDHSIVVFTSDHGEVLGEHEWIGHTRLWEEELRVPLLIRFPEARWASSLSDPVQHVDVLPTLLSALGIESPAGVQGVDLMPRIRGKVGASSSERMRTTQTSEQVTVRFDNRFKVVYSLDKRGVARRQPQGPQLYDLEADPSELEDLYQTAEGRQRYEEIWRRYRRWRTETSEEDERFRGTKRPLAEEEEHLRMLETLGYVTSERD